MASIDSGEPYSIWFNAKNVCNPIAPRPIVCALLFPFLTVGTASILEWSVTNVNARTATSTERSKSGDFIKFTMFVEPKLQLISVPKCSYS